MANKEQLAILKQGVAAWNTWREENPDAKINLRGAKLDGLDLSGANFRKADIRSADFHDSDLIGADFSESIIGVANEGPYYITSFIGSNLTGAFFDNSSIFDMNILNAKITNTSWRNIKSRNKAYYCSLSFSYFFQTLMCTSYWCVALENNFLLKVKNYKVHILSISICATQICAKPT